MFRATLACGLAASMCIGVCATDAMAQVPPVRPSTASSDYTFDVGTALLLFYVRPDRTAEFETVVARLAQALEANPDPARRQQAAAWRILRSSESGRDSVVYVFLLDPVVPGADYDPVRVLSESLPAEVQPLYEKLKASVVRVERLPLTKIR